MSGYPEIVRFTLGVSMAPVKFNAGVKARNNEVIGITQMTHSSIAIKAKNGQPLAISRKFKHKIGA